MVVRLTKAKMHRNELGKQGRAKLTRSIDTKDISKKRRIVGIVINRTSK